MSDYHQRILVTLATGEAWKRSAPHSCVVETNQLLLMYTCKQTSDFRFRLLKWIWNFCCTIHGTYKHHRWSSGHHQSQCSHLFQQLVWVIGIAKVFFTLVQDKVYQWIVASQPSNHLSTASKLDSYTLVDVF